MLENWIYYETFCNPDVSKVASPFRNSLGEMLEGSSNFPKLQTLDVSFNHLKTLPQNWLRGCPSLRTLILKGNLLGQY